MVETSKLRWGILGAARVNERLLPAIIESSNAELVAIASRRANAAKATLEKYAPCRAGGVQCYDDLDALISDSNVEAIYCPMANEEHTRWALKAINAGKHVLIEKPMALKVEDIQAIEAAAIEQNVKVMEGFMYRFHPQHARVQEIVDSGLIGDVLSARASFSFLMKPARMYRINRSMANGGGAMWDIGPYAIHALRWCFAKNGVPADPVSVIAHAKLNEHGADIVTSGVLDFGEDIEGRARFGHFDISFERSRKSEYEIIGTKGWVKCHAAWVFQNDVPVISWALEDGRYAEERFVPSNHFNLEIEHFSDCVLNNKPTYLNFADAKANCIAMQASIEAASNGVKVDV
ncbi:MAG: Gfo/Idh/MocA family oxidoreductase [Methylotenera sp.]|nr:Gfo/Idh/MocA family oxidoreductase [Methylotenera sp.]MDO9389906.1 Gfo/Idh/MocA family oxidoreductase [Methylotenera sp.]MDP2101510.1 Gfo/Idh/MocA family oxidoreductase [Methylotenera sp.]MDP2281920.1 Gfo/Idh/MocA family oxidoreductase [Methylotenera sp.]MDP3060799.1 Gfo/Idh/MocA family oxidoreductase [Methylotenera sp.]